MDGKILARVGAIVFVSLAITATAIELTSRDEAPAEEKPAMPALAPFDPLRAELHRCQLLGEAGGRDTACLRAWAENRRRFLGAGSQPIEPLPEPGPTPNLGSRFSAGSGIARVDEPQTDLEPPVKRSAAKRCGALADLGVLPGEC